MMCFLSRWARRLSWRETARVFGTSWECVYRSVEWFVEWGLAHRVLTGHYGHWGGRDFLGPRPPERGLPDGDLSD